MMPRPALPKVPAWGRAKAFGLNHGLPTPRSPDTLISPTRGFPGLVTAGAAVDQRRRSLSLLTSVSTSNVNFDDAPIYGQPSAGSPLHQRSKEPGGVRPPLLTAGLQTVLSHSSDRSCWIGYS